MLGMKYLLLFLLLIFSKNTASALDSNFEDPLTEGVAIEDCSSECDVQINMDEGLTTPIIIYAINPVPVTIEYKVPGQERVVNITVSESNTNNKWALVVNNVIDFEQVSDKTVFIDVNFEDTKKFIKLTFVNVDDTAATFSAAETPCVIPEGDHTDKEYCKYILIDEDGQLGSQFNFDFDNNGNTMFEFVLQDDPPNPSATYKIKPLQELDYEKQQLYSYSVTVYDVNPSIKYIARIVIDIEDVRDEPPKWLSIIPPIQINEETDSSNEYQAAAIDGDTQINEVIKYKLEKKEGNPLNDEVSMDEQNGMLTIKGIDREAYAVNSFQFTCTAFEANYPESFIIQDVTIVVNDINDQVPKITIDQANLEIEENSNGRLNMNIIIEDLDIGENAVYDVTLSGSGATIPYEEAFQIIPSEGYQKVFFTISVRNSDLLDFENEDWRMLKFKIFVTERNKPESTTEQEIQITLLNINDEEPVFDEKVILPIDENVLEDTLVTTVVAIDNDEGDKLHYSLLGTTANTQFKIDPTNGEITTKRNNVFNFEQLQEVYVVVQAMDCDPDECFGGRGKQHKTITQLTIPVGDINDEVPQIIINPEPVSVKENTAHGTVILEGPKVIAIDDDADGDLKFEIVWEQTRFLKDGVEMSDTACAREKCITANTDYPEPTKNKAQLKLQMNEPDANNYALDYEEFNIIYLRIQVTDQKQEINTEPALGTIQITIEDINDNKPVLVAPTTTLSVAEDWKNDVQIGIITANDVDTKTELDFSLSERDGTPPDLVKINSKDGRLTVANGDKLNADDPEYLEVLYYTVGCTDGLNDAEPLLIEIILIDVNDNPPTINDIAEVTNVLEHSDVDTLVTIVKADDKDRDEEHKTLSCSLNPEVTSFLQCIKETDGTMKITVRNKEELDRELYDPIEVTVTVTDGVGSDSKAFLIKLQDINDKQPFIAETTFETHEDHKKGQDFTGMITATDADKPGTVNSKISLEILEITAEGTSEIAPKNLFEIGLIADITGGIEAKIKAGEDLQGYHGSYILRVQAKDKGLPEMLSERNIKITIEKYNFYSPSFLIPLNNNEELFLRYDQEENKQLFLYNDDPLPDFRATDSQKEKYTLVLEMASADAADDGLFKLVTSGIPKNQARLTITRPLTDYETRKFTLKASYGNDADPSQPSAEINVAISFFDKTSEPKFEKDSYTLNWKENNTDLSDPLIQAKFPDTIPETLPIYYFVQSINPSMENTFEIDKNSGELSLLHSLDREATERIEVLVTASQKIEGSSNPPQGSMLLVIITVEDINDNPPNFKTDKYYGGIIYQSTMIKTILFKVEATDLDTTSIIKYSAKDFTGHDTSIQSIKEPFTVNTTTGDVSLNFEIQSTMKGYFKFTVEASDGEFVSTTDVNIYIATVDNRVEFTFENPVDDLERKKPTVIDILSKSFKYLCNIEATVQNTNADGTAMTTESILKTHFINPATNEPVPKQTILDAASSSQKYQELKQLFLKESLSLKQIKNDMQTTTDTADILQAWLIGVSVVLGTLIVVLIVAFVLRNRSLTQRLNKLSTTKFTSNESLANRKFNMPNSNKHINEGSNPIYSEEKKIPNFDTHSVTSGDSDLIGVEDNAEFDYSPGDRRASFNPVIQQDLNRNKGV